MIDSRTSLFCLLGHPVEHSFSPDFQNQLLTRYDINGSYLAFDVLPENLEVAVMGLKALNTSGFNVTIPHKENVIKYMDHLSEEADLIGAVNTVQVQGRELVGHNTDCYGFRRLLTTHNVQLSGKAIAVFGTGGASKAVITALILEGAARIDIFSRKPQPWSFVEGAKTRYSAELNILSYDDFHLYEKDYVCAVNCTPIGMAPHEGKMVIDPSNMNADSVLVDIIYNPETTAFLEIGKDRGMMTINGKDMLIYQGFKAFEIWTGMKPDRRDVVL